MVYEYGYLILDMHFDYHDLGLKSTMKRKLSEQFFQEGTNKTSEDQFFKVGRQGMVISSTHKSSE
jgi:hypothetical protein